MYFDFDINTLNNFQDFSTVISAVDPLKNFICFDYKFSEYVPIAANVYRIEIPAADTVLTSVPKNHSNGPAFFNSGLYIQESSKFGWFNFLNSNKTGLAFFLTEKTSNNNFVPVNLDLFSNKYFEMELNALRFWCEYRSFMAFETFPFSLIKSLLNCEGNIPLRNLFDLNSSAVALKEALVPILSSSQNKLELNKFLDYHLIPFSLGSAESDFLNPFVNFNKVETNIFNSYKRVFTFNPLLDEYHNKAFSSLLDTEYWWVMDSEYEASHFKQRAQYYYRLTGPKRRLFFLKHRYLYEVRFPKYKPELIWKYPTIEMGSTLDLKKVLNYLFSFRTQLLPDVQTLTTKVGVVSNCQNYPKSNLSMVLLSWGDPLWSLPSSTNHSKFSYSSLAFYHKLFSQSLGIIILSKFISISLKLVFTYLIKLSTKDRFLFSNLFWPLLWSFATVFFKFIFWIIKANYSSTYSSNKHTTDFAKLNYQFFLQARQAALFSDKLENSFFYGPETYFSQDSYPELVFEDTDGLRFSTSLLWSDWSDSELDKYETNSFFNVSLWSFTYGDFNTFFQKKLGFINESLTFSYIYTFVFYSLFSSFLEFFPKESLKSLKGFEKNFVKTLFRVERSAEVRKKINLFFLLSKLSQALLSELSVKPLGFKYKFFLFPSFITFKLKISLSDWLYLLVFFIFSLKDEITSSPSLRIFRFSFLYFFDLINDVKTFISSAFLDLINLNIISKWSTPIRPDQRDRYLPPEEDDYDEYMQFDYFQVAVTQWLNKGHEELFDEISTFKGWLSRYQQNSWLKEKRLLQFLEQAPCSDSYNSAFKSANFLNKRSRWTEESLSPDFLWTNIFLREFKHIPTSFEHALDKRFPKPDRNAINFQASLDFVKPFKYYHQSKFWYPYSYPLFDFQTKPLEQNWNLCHLNNNFQKIKFSLIKQLLISVFSFFLEIVFLFSKLFFYIFSLVKINEFKYNFKTWLFFCKELNILFSQFKTPKFFIHNIHSSRFQILMSKSLQSLILHFSQVLTFILKMVLKFIKSFIVRAFTLALFLFILNSFNFLAYSSVFLQDFWYFLEQSFAIDIQTGIFYRVFYMGPSWNFSVIHDIFGELLPLLKEIPIFEEGYFDAWEQDPEFFDDCWAEFFHYNLVELPLLGLRVLNWSMLPISWQFILSGASLPGTLFWTLHSYIIFSLTVYWALISTLLSLFKPIWFVHYYPFIFSLEGLSYFYSVYLNMAVNILSIFSSEKAALLNSVLFLGSKDLKLFDLVDPNIFYFYKVFFYKYAYAFLFSVYANHALWVNLLFNFTSYHLKDITLLWQLPHFYLAHFTPPVLSTYNGYPLGNSDDFRFALDKSFLTACRISFWEALEYLQSSDEDYFYLPSAQQRFMAYIWQSSPLQLLYHKIAYSVLNFLENYIPFYNSSHSNISSSHRSEFVVKVLAWYSHFFYKIYDPMRLMFGDFSKSSLTSYADGWPTAKIVWPRFRNQTGYFDEVLVGTPAYNDFILTNTFSDNFFDKMITEKPSSFFFVIPALLTYALFIFISALFLFKSGMKILFFQGQSSLSSSSHNFYSLKNYEGLKAKRLFERYKITKEFKFFLKDLQKGHLDDYLKKFNISFLKSNVTNNHLLNFLFSKDHFSEAFFSNDAEFCNSILKREFFRYLRITNPELLKEFQGLENDFYEHLSFEDEYEWLTDINFSLEALKCDADRFTNLRYRASLVDDPNATAGNDSTGLIDAPLSEFRKKASEEIVYSDHFYIDFEFRVEDAHYSNYTRFEDQTWEKLYLDFSRIDHYLFGNRLSYSSLHKDHHLTGVSKGPFTYDFHRILFNMGRNTWIWLSAFMWILFFTFWDTTYFFLDDITTEYDGVHYFLDILFAKFFTHLLSYLEYFIPFVDFVRGSNIYASFFDSIDWDAAFGAYRRGTVIYFETEFASKYSIFIWENYELSYNHECALYYDPTRYWSPREIDFSDIIEIETPDSVWERRYIAHQWDWRPDYYQEAYPHWFSPQRGIYAHELYRNLFYSWNAKEIFNNSVFLKFYNGFLFSDFFVFLYDFAELEKTFVGIAYFCYYVFDWLPYSYSEANGSTFSFLAVFYVLYIFKQNLSISIISVPRIYIIDSFYKNYSYLLNSKLLNKDFFNKFNSYFNNKLNLKKKIK